MANYDDLSTPKIAAVGFIGAIAVFALIILLQAVFYWTEAQQRIEKDINQPALEFANLTADQQAKLASYRWVDQEQKIVSIPINRAMELVLARLSQDLQSSEKKGDNLHSSDKEQTHAQ
jgi:hypothetical protein